MTINGPMATQSRAGDAPGPKVAPAGASSDVYYSFLGIILVGAAIFRLCNLDTLPPFIDETASLNATIDPQTFPELARVFNGKFLGFLLFKPIYQFSYNPLYCARFVMALIGIANAAVVAAIARKLGGRVASVVSCAVIAFSPILVFHDRIALFDQLAMLLAATGLLLNTMALERGKGALIFWGAIAFVLACSTKAYYLVLFPMLYLPDFVSGNSHRTLWRKSLLVAAGFIAGAVILALFMEKSLAELYTLSHGKGGLIQLFNIQRDFTAVSAVHPTRLDLMFSNVGYLGEVLLTYQGRAFWMLFAAAIFAIAGRRKILPAIYPLAVAEFALLALSAWLSIQFPRYVNLVMLPIALQIGLAAGGVFETGLPPCERKWIENFAQNPLRLLQGVLLAVFGCLSLLNTCKRDFRIMDDQFHYWDVPLRDHRQYQVGSGSGLWIAETVDFIRNYCMRAGSPVVLWTVGGMVHGNSTFPLLLRDQGNLQYIHLWSVQPEDLQKIIDSKTRVLLLTEPDSGIINRLDLEKHGFKFERLYRSPAMSEGGQYEIDLVETNIATGAQ